MWIKTSYDAYSRRIRRFICFYASAPGLRCVEIDGKPVGKQAPEMVSALQKWVKDEIFAATEAD